MYFRDTVHSPDEWLSYERNRNQLTVFVGDCVAFLGDAMAAVDQSPAVKKCFSHGTIVALLRHQLASTDGIAILVSEGCAEMCPTLLRGAFEAELGISFILQKDSRRRGLAYQVADIHRRINFYRSLSPQDEMNRQLRSQLRSDPLVDLLDAGEVDVADKAAKLEAALCNDEYRPIEKEWQALRTKKNGRKSTPAWYSLFSGPRSIEDLARRVDQGALYAVVYRLWSGVIHGSSAFENFGPGDEPSGVAVRPLRHPAGLELACTYAGQFALMAAHSVVAAYAPERMPLFRRLYAEKISSRYLAVSKGGLINSPWKGSS